MSIINPFDILSGKVVQNDIGTFYFKEPGNNIFIDGHPIWSKVHRLDGPAVIWPNNVVGWYINGEPYKKREFDEIVKCMKK